MTEKKSLIYLAVFINPDFINLVDLLLTSLKLYGKFDASRTDIMVLTDETFKPKIDGIALKLGLPIQYYYLTINTKWQSSAARLDIFQNEHIDNYDTILYVDTDILVNKDINTLLNLPIRDDKLYALGEGQLGSLWWGHQFFNYEYNSERWWAEGFCAGILLFKNSLSMKELFAKIKSHIHQYVFVENNPPPKYWDQPFIVYNAVIEDKYENQLLKKYVINNRFYLEPCDIILYHFPIGPGSYQDKYENMVYISEQQKYFYNPSLLNKLVGYGDRKFTSWLTFIKPDRLTPFNYLEIGVLCGHTLVTFERIYGRHPDSKMFGIDSWELTNKEYASNYTNCLTNILSTGCAEKFELRKGFSYTEITRLNDNFFDFIYFNGNHNTANIVEDIVLSFRKLKSGGYLIFNDYGVESVKKGVDMFTAAYSDKINWVGINWGQNFFRKC